MIFKELDAMNKQEALLCLSSRSIITFRIRLCQSYSLLPSFTGVD
ncbi:hypothetical protein pb186bvf_020659 [Paramecium bursaria]